MSTEKKSSHNFFKDLFSNLFGSKDEESEKRRKIKSISKKFNKSKYNKYYKFSSNEISPSFPKLFYDIYKIILPSQRMFESYKNPAIFKKIVIHHFIPDDLKQIEASLTEENLKSLAKEIPIDRLKTTAEERLTAFNDFFTAEIVTKIETSYKQLMAFKDFCEFDYFFMLKKFNKSLSESNINQISSFEKISAEYIADDIKDFADIIYSMPDFQDWSELFDILKYMRGSSSISPSTWKKIIAKITSLRLSNALQMMIQMITNDPNYIIIKKEPVQPITERYLESMRSETTSVISKLVAQDKSNKTAASLSELFGNNSVELLKYYTEETSQELKSKQLSPFTYCNALNYLKAFMIYIAKTELRDFYDIIIVRGKWESPVLCTPVSNAYHSLTFVSDKITMFDEELAETKPTGMKIKNLLPKAARDNSSRNIINRVVSDTNNMAFEIINTTMRNIIIIGKIIKSLVDDLSKPKPEMLTNWHEVEHFCEEPMRPYLIKLYKKIYQFNVLIKSNIAKE